MKLKSNLVFLFVGLMYGILSILGNYAYINSFETPILKTVFVPGVFLLFGIGTVFLTRVGLTLLLWAGAKGMGGSGRLGQIHAQTPVALVPGLLGAPFLIGIGSGNTLIVLMLLVSIAWMYLISSKILKTTQGISTAKAYIGTLAAFVFLACVYYLIVPA